MENCCKNCKHRLGDKGREREIILHGKYPIKIFSNCAKFAEMAEFGFDPSPTCGVSISFKETHCCKHFELSGNSGQFELFGKTEQVTEPVDFSEPRPSQYEKDEKEPTPPEPEIEPEPPPPPDETYDDGDIPF